jgi:hypothetical protein
VQSANARCVEDEPSMVQSSRERVQGVHRADAMCVEAIKL